MASITKRHWVAASVLAACVLLPGAVPAQSSRTSGTSGQSSRSSGAGATTQAIQSSQSNLGSQSSQSGQSGQSSQSGQSGQLSTMGQTTGSERFLRENRDPGQMVGGGGEGVGNLRGATDTAGQGSSGMFGNQGGFNSSMNQFGNSFFGSQMMNAMSRQRQTLRVPLRIGPGGVSFFSSSNPAVATGPNLRIQNHLARVPQLKNRGSVKVEMEGAIAVLRGEVSSEHERDLVARLVLLEPGIADVRNELVLSAPLPPPPAP